MHVKLLSAVTTLKNKNCALKLVKMVLRPALTTIEPMFDEIFKKKQVQSFHSYNCSSFVITTILFFSVWICFEIVER